jgi:type II secretory pathway pseudopilin PulG
MMQRHVLLVLTVLLLALLPQAARAATDEDVVQAIERAKEFLLSHRQGDGSWPETSYRPAPRACGQTEMALFTLVCLGVPATSDVITGSLDGVLSRTLDYNYAVCFRVMALSRLQNQVPAAKREAVRTVLQTDVRWLIQAQTPDGGWTYLRPSGSRNDQPYDLSNTQMAILALREATLAGIEVPNAVWQKAQALYFKAQKQDGSWAYREHQVSRAGEEVPGYGSMTAAGLASIFITADSLEPGRGCPCQGGKSARSASEVDRRMETAIAWLEKNYTADSNPKYYINAEEFFPYWLYAAERVGSAAGYKYFGTRNWYKEGVEVALKNQQPNGSWGTIPDTCFSALFLYKGRAPILFNKLQYKGEWNLHRRDIANLTAYIERTKEQPFHWQIVGLAAPLEELHDAPILYITAESPPAFTEEEKKKLRAFTDTGGTILFEASCGNPGVRRWFPSLAKEVWPEWALKPLGPTHASYTDPYVLKQRPEILGIDDGLRTILFFALDDISCHWTVKAMAGREYLFQWGINLFTYATDRTPLRGKLASRDTAKADRYNALIRKGAKDTLRMARVKYDGAWDVGRHYGVLAGLAAHLNRKALITLKTDDGGVGAADLADRDVAYLAGAGPLKLADPERSALKQYLGKGGFIWVEAVGGSAAFDKEFRKAAGELGWELKLLAPEHPLMSGKFKDAIGYHLASGIQFRRALRVVRAGRTYAELVGIYQNGQLAGVYSPFDVLFSATGYEAYGCLGYLQPDAQAVGVNVVVYLTDRAAEK